MDAVTRVLLAVGVFLLSAIACAQETAAGYEPMEQEILQFAFERMNTAVAAQDQRERECEKVRKRVLDPALFKSISLSNSEWRMVLGTFGRRATNKCAEDGPLLGRALIALMQFKAAEKHYKGKNIIKTRYDPEDLCCGNWELRIRDDLRFQKLDPQIIKALESIPELNEPFDIHATGDALGIMKE